MRNSQTKKILRFLSDGLPHNTYEFQTLLFGSSQSGLFRLGARINDLKNMGYDIRGYWSRNLEGRRIYVYQYFPPKPLSKEEEKVEMDKHLIESIL